MMTPDKPREFAVADIEERQFWQGVRASPTRTARDIRSRFKDIDRRLADIESYVTTENRSLAREIDQLALRGNSTDGQCIATHSANGLPWIAGIVVVSVGGWVSRPGSGSRTAIRSKPHGACRCTRATDHEATERIKLLTNENAQLRAEMGSLKDRLETIERIVTDQPSQLAREIDSLSAIDKGGRADGPRRSLYRLHRHRLADDHASGYLFHRWFKLKEKKLEVEAGLAVEKAAQYAAQQRRARGAPAGARADRHRRRHADRGADRGAARPPEQTAQASSWKRIGALMNPLELVVADRRDRHVRDGPEGSLQLRSAATASAIGAGTETAEAARLREEVKQLKERIHVLERITTDSENSLSREIEELRDR